MLTYTSKPMTLEDLYPNPKPQPHSKPSKDERTEKPSKSPLTTPLQKDLVSSMANRLEASAERLELSQAGVKL